MKEDEAKEAVERIAANLRGSTQAHKERLAVRLVWRSSEPDRKREMLAEVMGDRTVKDITNFLIAMQDESDKDLMADVRNFWPNLPAFVAYNGVPTAVEREILAAFYAKMKTQTYSIDQV